jgi:peptidoglycan/LPS O-acetylase OafA/YrhL
MRHRRATVSPAVSVLLDATRLFLALLVVIGHWTQPMFQHGWPNLTALGVMAVGGFFVLSGFTIRMIYPTPAGFDFRSYISERFSRIWSVALPALALTVALDALAFAVNPEYYTLHWGRQADGPLWRLLVNAVGVSQVWGQDISPLSNSPFWSIAYELGFYVVFGLWYARYRVFAVLALVALGPNIAVLFGCWLLGVVLYDLVGRDVRRSLPVTAGLGVLGLVGAAALYLLTGPIQSGIAWFGVSHARVSRLILLSAPLAFGVYAVAIGLAQQAGSWQPTARVQAAVRAVGNLTFPLYLFHFPLFVAIGALGLYDRGSALQKLAWLVVVVFLIVALAPVTDWLKGWLRRALSPRTATTQTSGALVRG